jgi:hypothetical protein
MLLKRRCSIALLHVSMHVPNTPSGRSFLVIYHNLLRLNRMFSLMPSFSLRMSFGITFPVC